MKTLKDNKSQLDRLANALLQYETLSAEEVVAVIEGKDIRKSIPKVTNTVSNLNNPNATSVKQPLGGLTPSTNTTQSKSKELY